MCTITPDLVALVEHVHERKAPDDVAHRRAHRRLFLREFLLPELRASQISPATSGDAI
jgi:hypothetical protein